MSEIPNARRRLADYLSEYAHNAVEEWMRIVDIDADVEEPGSSAFQARAGWAGDGTFTLGLDRYSADFGQYRLVVKVEPLPDIDVSIEIEPQEPVPEWIATEWQYVLTGDHVRIGQEEADIKASSVIMWHAHEDGWEWNEQAGRNEMKVSRWDHKDVTITRASHPTEKLKFPPGTPVEVLMNRERQAQHLLQTTFDAKPVQK